MISNRLEVMLLAGVAAGMVMGGAAILISYWVHFVILVAVLVLALYLDAKKVRSR